MKRFILIAVSGLLCFVCCKVADLLNKPENNVVGEMAFSLCFILGLCFGVDWCGGILLVFFETAYKIVMGV